MSIVLCTLALNEMEWLPSLYEQHSDWPDLAAWIFVESADRMYARANPGLVSPEGLSTDGTSAYLDRLAESDPRVRYIPYGFCGGPDPAQGKCEARQQYLDAAERYTPQFLFVLDADEFYTHADQRQVNERLLTESHRYTAFLFRQREIWRPPSIAHEPLFQYEVMGGYWDVRHKRGWRWSRGLKYDGDHNTPRDASGVLLSKHMARYDRKEGAPQCVHLGFASSGRMRAAKNAYYVERGEGVTDHRKMYVTCRAAFETWRPHDPLPHGARVRAYEGPIPEVFK